MGSLRELLRRIPKGALLLVLTLAWWNWGIEDLRLGHVPDLKSHPLAAVSPPWWPLRAYVSRSGDEEVYFEDSHLVLGEDARLRYLAEKRQGDIDGALAEITHAVRPGAGLRLPYRDFPFEYPPLALVPMVIPRLFASTLAGYRLSYGILAALLTLTACALGVKLLDGPFEAPPRYPWRRMAFIVLAMGPVIVARFDPFPALLTTVAVLLLSRERSFLAGCVTGLGFMTKLYPVLLLVPWVALLLGERRTRAALALAAGAALASLAVAAPFLVLAPFPFLRSTFVYGARPFQIEGLVGALVVLFEGKSAIVGSFGSYNVDTPLWMGRAFSLFLPVGIGLVSLLAAREGSKRPDAPASERVTRLVLVTVASLYVVLVTSKVLSPQYLIWLVPLAVATPEKVIHRWAVGAAALTQVFYPILYDFLVDGSRLVALLVVARNVLLLCALAATVRAAMALSRRTT